MTERFALTVFLGLACPWAGAAAVGADPSPVYASADEPVRTMAAGGWEFPWFTIDGGGGRSSDESFAIEGTIGQPDSSGTSSGGGFDVTGGFWVGPVETSCPPDLGGDGTVGFDDLLLVLAAWGPCDCTSCPEDLDGDCEVGFGDLLLILAAWGPC